MMDPAERAARWRARLVATDVAKRWRNPQVARAVLTWQANRPERTSGHASGPLPGVQPLAGSQTPPNRQNAAERANRPRPGS